MSPAFRRCRLTIASERDMEPLPLERANPQEVTAVRYTRKRPVSDEYRDVVAPGQVGPGTSMSSIRAGLTSTGEPVLEQRRPKPRILSRCDPAVPHHRPVVPGLRVRDQLPLIPARGHELPHELGD